MEQERAAESRTEILKVACSAADSVNIAFYQNAIPIIRELAIENELGRDLSGISVHLAAEPPFLMPGIWRIERITDRATHHIRSLDLKLDPAFLAGINASRRGELRIRVEVSGETLAEQTIDVNLLPPSYWGGVKSAPELLAALPPSRAPNGPADPCLARWPAEIVMV